MAGPLGSTSETTTAVSPFTGLGLSRPPETAKPKPTLESCEQKNKQAHEWMKEWMIKQKKKKKMKEQISEKV